MRRSVFAFSRASCARLPHLTKLPSSCQNSIHYNAVRIPYITMLPESHNYNAARINFSDSSCQCLNPQYAPVAPKRFHATTALYSSQEFNLVPCNFAPLDHHLVNRSLRESRQHYTASDACSPHCGADSPPLHKFPSRAILSFKIPQLYIGIDNWQTDGSQV